MTSQDVLKRNEKAQGLKVWQVDNAWFYVESEDGKIAYKCCVTDQGDFCNCGDFATRSKNDPNFKCKHLLAVFNSIPRNQILTANFLERNRPRLDERFIKSIDGKDFVLYAGLLDLAHQKNLVSIDVELLQYPSKENDLTAVCRAVAKTATEGPFIDVGDANPVNCNSKVGKHLIRMASTRAKARCLRDLTNIGMTALEELGDLDEVMGEEVQPPASRKNNVRKMPVRQVKESAAVTAKEAPPPAGVEHPVKPETPEPQSEAVNPENPEAAKPAKAKAAKAGNGNGKTEEKPAPSMSEAQKNAIYNLSRRRNVSLEELEEMSMKIFNTTVENLSSADASLFIRTLQQAS